jgi:hypothetical protein
MQAWVMIAAGGVGTLAVWAGLVLYPALRPAAGPAPSEMAPVLDIGSMVLAEEHRARHARREIVLPDTGGWINGPMMDLQDEPGWPGLPGPVFPDPPGFPPLAGDGGRVAPGAPAGETGAGTGEAPAPVSSIGMFDLDEIARRHGWPTLAAQNRHSAAFMAELAADYEGTQEWMTEAFLGMREQLEES